LDDLDSINNSKDVIEIIKNELKITEKYLRGLLEG
jgi:hypothetical protein